MRQLRRFLGLVNFYRCFLPHCADILAPLTDLLRDCPERPCKSTNFTWSKECETAFSAIKRSLANVTMLAHPSSSSSLSLMVDASDTAVGGVLQQAEGGWRHIAFLSQKLLQAETRYSTFGRELLAMYLAIKYFRHFLEGCHFCINTDHKRLTRALHSKANRHSPREIRHLDFVSQFITDISHVRGKDNIVTDTLSHFDVATIHTSSSIDFDQNAADQTTSTSLQFRQVPLPATHGSIWCDVSTGHDRPFVPAKHRRSVFPPPPPHSSVGGVYERILTCRANTTFA